MGLRPSATSPVSDSNGRIDEKSQALVHRPASHRDGLGGVVMMLRLHRREVWGRGLLVVRKHQRVG